MNQRPIGVTILAVLAGIAAVLVVVHFVQAPGILPYLFGPIAIRGFNLWYTIMWGLMIWVWVWLEQMLWRVDPSAWTFLAMVTLFNLLFNFFAMVGPATTFSDVSLSFLVNALILIYVLLPGTKNAFGIRPA